MKPAVPPGAQRPRRPVYDLVSVLWMAPLIAVPFAAFFVLVQGAPLRAFGDYWMVAAIMAAFTLVARWPVRHVIERPLRARLENDPRSPVIIAFLHLTAAIVGSFAGALVLHFTLMPSLGSGRSLAMLGAYTLLFGVLFTGIALAMSLYRRSLDRAVTERELQLARRIQRSFLPSEFPRRPRLDVFAVNVPSKEVSGDFYDVVQAADGSVLLAIADVSGKGVPAALLSSMLQASLRTQADGRTSPAAMMGTINALACQRDTTGQFATFFLAAVHEPSMRLSFTNAGHNFPVLLRADGSRVLLETGGIIVGMMDGVHYGEEQLVLAAGDRLVLYTDGVTEAANGAGEMFGEERLYACLASLPADQPASAIVDAVLGEVRRFLAGMEAGDDITIMAVRVLEEGAVSAAG